MDKYRPKVLELQAESYIEDTVLKLGQVTITVPAGHTVAYYPGGAVVTPTEDFKALWTDSGAGVVKRGYE